MQQTVLFSDQESSSTDMHNNTSKEIAVNLDDKKNTADGYDQKITDLQTSIADVYNIIIHHTASRSKYQSVYNAKIQDIRDLQTQYEAIVWEKMSDTERQEFEDQKQKEEEMWQEIFSGMGFDQDRMRGEFDTEEEFFQHQQKEKKNRSDANYVKINMEEVTGELVDQMKDLPLKAIYRKISALLHPDKLAQNNEVEPYADYLTYLNSVYLKVIDARQKDDKGAMILLIQQAGICYRDGTFFVASYADFKDIAVHENKKALIQELQDRLHVLKTSYIYVFYLKHTQGEIQKELRDLDDKIQELNDLIASYQTTDEQPSTVK